MNKFSLFSIMLFFACAVLFSCNNSGNSNAAAGSSSAFDSVAAKKAVDSVNHVFTENLAKGDSVGAANCYTADAEFMGSNMPAIVGRKNIQSGLAEFIKSGVTKIAIKTTALWGNADLLAEEGTYTLAMQDGKQVDKGKYIVLWKKEDGKWKILRDCSNSDLPVTVGK